MSISPDSTAKFNLQHATVLVLDANPLSMNIMVQILNGFGAKQLTRCKDQASAEVAVTNTQFDLMIVDSTGASQNGIKFVNWLRRSGIEPNCYGSVLLTSGHTAQSAVVEARDCGAHFLIAKPLTPLVVLERIIWISKEGRKFLECDTYVGPDRRFKHDGVPVGTIGRRKDDLPPEVGEATMPNMEQNMIDSMVKARKVSL